MKKPNVKMLIMSALMAAVICVTAVISFKIGVIPITLALLGIFLTATMLEPKYAALSVVVYLLLGIIGVPVFSGFSSGIGVLAGPTGGYIVSYIFVALIVSIVTKRFNRNVIAMMVSLIVAIAVCYAFGTAWFLIYTKKGLAYALAACVTPFIIPDIIKGVVTCVIIKLLEKTPVFKMLYDK